MELLHGVIVFVLGTIVGGIIEIFVTVVFDKTARKYYRKVRRVLLIVSSIRDNKFGMERELYRIGKSETNVIILEGTPTQPYAPDKVNCYLEADRIALPDELHLLRDQIELEQKVIKGVKGTEDFHNGEMVAFTDFKHGYTQRLEEPTLILKFKATDYYTFMATALKIDDVVPGSSPAATLRSKYIGRESYRRPNPYFATSFGVNICVVTNDNYAIIARRADSRVSHYHGLHSVPVMESVNPVNDRDINSQLDVYQTAIRGTREELGIDIEKRNINFFTLQVDVNYYLYGLTGSVMLEDYGREDIRGIISRGIDSKWENSDIEFVNFEPHAVSAYVQQTGGVSHFHPAGFVSILQSLIYIYGQRKVTKAFR